MGPENKRNLALQPICVANGYWSFALVRIQIQVRVVIHHHSVTWNKSKKEWWSVIVSPLSPSLPPPQLNDPYEQMMKMLLRLYCNKPQSQGVGAVRKVKRRAGRKDHHTTSLFPFYSAFFIRQKIPSFSSLPQLQKRRVASRQHKQTVVKKVIVAHRFAQMMLMPRV